MSWHFINEKTLNEQTYSQDENLHGQGTFDQFDAMERIQLLVNLEFSTSEKLAIIEIFSMVLCNVKNRKQGVLNGSVGDPWHFDADPDPDPRIRTSG